MNARRSGVLICCFFAFSHTPMTLAGSRGHPSAPALVRPAAHFSGGAVRHGSPANGSRNSPSAYRNNAFRNGHAVYPSGNFNRGAHPRWVSNGNPRWNGNWNGHGRGRHHCGNRVIYIGSFGYPWYLPSYSYYDSYYPYGYYPYGTYPATYTYETGSSSDQPVYEGTPADRTDQSYDNAGAGAPGSTVLEVQRRLARDGFYQGSLDGALGSRTYYAIRAYQRSHHLRVDGQLSPQLLGALGLR